MSEEKKGTSGQCTAVVARLKNADPVMWHRIIMCVMIAFIGVAIIGGVVIDFVLDRQVQEIRHTPVVGMTENAVLPAGSYHIYRVYLDGVGRNWYLVSSTEGGVVVSASAPDGTDEPKDILAMIRYDPASYTLIVNQADQWMFVSTPVREQILHDMKRQESSADAAT